MNNRAVNAGTYTVVGSITDSNYTGTATATLAISKATAPHPRQPSPDLRRHRQIRLRLNHFQLPRLSFTYKTKHPSHHAAPTPSSAPSPTATPGTTTGTLAISKATGALALGNLTQTYDGTAKSASASTTPSGLAVNLTYNGSSNPVVNAGSYTVVGSITDSNYSGTATGTLAISKATGALTLGNLAQTYDGTAKSASASTTPSGLAVNLTYNG